MTTGPPIPEIIWHGKFYFKGQCQRHPDQRSIQFTHFLFCFLFGPTIPNIWNIECSIGENRFKFTKAFVKKVPGKIPPKFNQVNSMTRGIYLPSFVAIGWAVLTLSWGQIKFCPAPGAWWPWPKVTEMGVKKFSDTHRLTTSRLLDSVPAWKVSKRLLRRALNEWGDRFDTKRRMWSKLGA